MDAPTNPENAPSPSRSASNEVTTRLFLPSSDVRPEELADFALSIALTPAEVAAILIKEK